MEIDIHSHKWRVSGVIQLLNLDVNSAVNIPALESYFSLGIHPWDIQHLNISDALEKLEKLCRHPLFLALGECGLDKSIATPISLQIEVFSAQIALAKRLEKPMIIHCVRAYNELLHLKKTLQLTRSG